MEYAYQSLDDFLCEEWRPNWAGVANSLNFHDLETLNGKNDFHFAEHTLPTFNEFQTEAIDTDWDLFGLNSHWDTAPWQTSQPRQANDVDWTPLAQWAAFSEAGIGNDMNMEDIQLGLSDTHPHLLSPNIGPASGSGANDTGTNGGSEDGASRKAENFALDIFHSVVYTRETCATCEAPLDSNEQLLNFGGFANIYCTRSRAASHLPLICEHTGCGLKFSTFSRLVNHASLTKHKATRCAVPGCKQRVEGRGYGHSGLHGPIKYSCAQCGLVFDRKTFLDNHGRDTLHAAYVCKYPDCGSESTRIADLLRHQLTHKADVPRHPCPHCRNYRGSNGFKRRDHLRQHIRNYHRIENTGNQSDSSLFACRDKACAYDYDEALALKTHQQLTDHMIQSHGSSPYVCQDMRCDRVLMNGFDTDKLLKIHLKKDHRSPFQCSAPGCDRVGTKGWMRKRDMVKHMKNAHGITE